MTEDLFTRLYARASQDGDEELLKLLNGVAAKSENTKKEIDQITAEREFWHRSSDHNRGIIHLVGKHPDKAKQIYDAWDSGYPISEEDFDTDG